MFVQILALLYFAVLAWIDVRKKALPTMLLGLGMIPAICASCYGIAVMERSWEEMLLGFVPGLIFLCLAGLGLGAGAGDGIVLLQLNLYFFWEKTVLAFGISLMAIGLFALGMLLTKAGTKDTKLPFLPFLWVGCLGATLL